MNENKNLLKGPAFCVCAGCNQPFPKSWLKTRGAIEENGRYYCQPNCPQRPVGLAAITASRINKRLK